MVKPRSVAAFFALAFTLSIHEASAQPTTTCIPGTQWCAQVDPSSGSVRVQPPPVPSVGGNVDVRVDQEARARAEAQVRAQAEARARAQYEAWRVAWEAYFKWEAQLRIDAEIRVRGQLEAYYYGRERAKPDRYQTIPSPVTLPPSPPVYSYPRVEFGILGACFGVWSRPGHPWHEGYCPDLRFRFDESWGIALDPTLLSNTFGDRGFTTVGVHPGVTYSFANGRGSMSIAHAYLIAGGDLWIPIDHFAATPDILVGGHVGIGAHVLWGRAGFGAEWRGLVRAGLADEEDPRAADVARFRVGSEVRFHFLLLSL